MDLVFALSSIRNVIRIFVELFWMCVFYEFSYGFFVPKEEVKRPDVRPIQISG